MKKAVASFEYEVYSSADQLTETDQQLMQEAKLALKKSYSPYSKFKVGAAALVDGGKIVTGANMENAAYPMCICAEGVVLSSVESAFPGQKINTIAITAKSSSIKLLTPPTPCGACRQLISEKENRQGAPIRVILFAEDTEIYLIQTIKDILPFSFDGSVI
jgi:cytidine deaminase